MYKQTSWTFYKSFMSRKYWEKKLLGRNNKDISLKMC